MTTNQRRTIMYKGIKVRYTHLSILKNCVRYTTTELDEVNLDRLKKAYNKQIQK